MAAAGFRELAASFLDLRWQLDPVAATMAGVGTHDGRLGRFSSGDIRAAVAAAKSLSNAFEELEPGTRDVDVDVTAILNDLRVTVGRFEKERPHELNPEFHLSHLLQGLFALIIRRDQPAEQRATSLAARLGDVPRFLADAKATLGRPARVFTDTGLHVARGGQALLREAIPAFAATVTPAERALIEQALPEAKQALEGFHEFLAGELADRSDGDFAIGRDAFDFRLHFEHALRETSPEILRYGKRLVEEVDGELAAMGDALAPGVPWRATADRLRATCPPEDTAVPAYAGQMERARRFVFDHGIATIPPGDLEVIATPSFMRPLVPFAAYDPPGAFAEDRTGWFYVTEPDKKASRDHCMHELACTALHEGYPGHHLQFLVAHRSPSPVRRVISSALTVEGWALYCEELMAREGFLTKPEERFFQRVHLLWRAVRIVLDVQLHTGGMTFEEATRYLTDTLGIERASAEAEVRRYCATPSYNLCYALGRREFLKLRDDVRQRDGASFSLKRFHDEVLSYGGLPVSLIRWGMGLGD